MSPFTLSQRVSPQRGLDACGLVSRFDFDKHTPETTNVYHSRHAPVKPAY